MALLNVVPTTAAELEKYDALYHKLEKYCAENIDTLWPTNVDGIVSDSDTIWREIYYCQGEHMNVRLYRDQFIPKTEVEEVMMDEGVEPIGPHIDLERYTNLDTLAGFTPFGRCNILIDAFHFDAGFMSVLKSGMEELGIEAGEPIDK